MPASSRAVRRTTAALLVVTATAALSGCAQLADAFNTAQTPTQNVVPDEPEVAATAPLDEDAFESAFTRDGSVSLSTEIAEGLEVRLDVWAADPKRTMEWTAGAEKTFGFAVNVHDHRVDEKAVLAQKRRVYLSQVAITSQTTQRSQQVSAPFQFTADPRTLVPVDTLRSDRGLLLNSFQGGLLVPETTIHQLPDDTDGITLQFALTVAVEATANDDDTFQQQTVYQVLPIAISQPAA